MKKTHFSGGMQKQRAKAKTEVDYTIPSHSDALQWVEPNENVLKELN